MVRARKILIVDDEDRLLESLALLLKKKNYDVITASHGRQASQLFEKMSFDLVILDIHLPDMQGTELMCNLKASHPETVVILVTGNSDVDSALEALKCGAYSYLRKPFEFEELLQNVENALNQRMLVKEKEQIYERLRQSEKKYRYLVQNSPDIIFTLDADGYFTFLSEAAEQLLGFSINELIGQHYSRIVHEADRSKVRRYFNSCRFRHRESSGVELRLKVNGEVPRLNDRLSYLSVELKSIGMREKSIDNGEWHHIGTHGVIRDISERQRLQAQLQRAERMEALGTLAGGIAHDFNNLLMGIQGRSSLIAMELRASHSHFEHLHAIDNYILSAAELTRQLLGFARGGKYEVKTLDINALIRNSLSMFGRTRKEIIIQTRFQEATTMVEVDRSQMEQVLLNLYVNAWQAMPKGGTLRMETMAVQLDEAACGQLDLAAGRYAHIMVTDSGTGIDAQTLQQIFDPFFTTKEKGRGTGLGLASAYGIIKNHGGAIHAQSELGCGTTFNIFLPITEKPAVREWVSQENFSTGSETVLLVDDEDMIIDVGKALLERLGYQVIAAKSGEAAVATVRRRGDDIDLVILDMIMPGMGGGRTFDQIRKIDAEMPVVLSSGYAVNDRVLKIMRRGCNGFIQKPFTLAAMSQKIRNAIAASGI
mgnify:CR=1 FL=1